MFNFISRLFRSFTPEETSKADVVPLKPRIVELKRETLERAFEEAKATFIRIAGREGTDAAMKSYLQLSAFVLSRAEDVDSDLKLATDLLNSYVRHYSNETK